MVDPNFQATNVRWSGTPRAAAVDSEVPRGNVKPTDAGKSLATTQLEHDEVCHGGVFACRKNVYNESVETWSKSCREPFRVERGGYLVQTWMQCASRGVCHRASGLSSYGMPN